MYACMHVLERVRVSMHMCTCSLPQVWCMRVST